MEGINQMIQEAKKVFRKQFGKSPEFAGIAPGRVNLIGEHIDYNAGFVFPMAMPLYTVVVGSLADSNSRVCKVLTTSDNADPPHLFEFDLPSKDCPLTPSKSTSWVNYFLGVVANFHGDLKSFNAAIVSNVPLGGGLSSSAALEVASYSFLEEISGNYVTDLKNKATACQAAEHQFANMPCGIMDQYVSVMAKENHALLIDCRSLECEQIPLTDPDISVVVCNSNVRHSLTGSEYPARRSDCHNTASVLKKDSLREATLSDLQENVDKVSPVAFKRARHVITEISRVESAVASLKVNNYKTFGELMTQSHESLRDDFEVSCPELDELVALSLTTKGVYGARMTGGGFGGCIVILVSNSNVEELKKNISEKYSGTPTFYVCKPSKGAFSLKL